MTSALQPGPRRVRGQGRPRRPSLGLFARAALLALAVPCLGALPGAAQGTVALVRSADGFAPFETAIKELRKGLDASMVEESLKADAERWSRARQALEKKEPAVWVPVGPLALKLAAQVSEPVVFLMVATPEDSVPEGADHVCGVSLRVAPDVQLQEIRRLLPAAKSVGILYDPGRETSNAEVAVARKAAARLGLTLEERTMTDRGQLADGLRGLLGARIDVLWLLADRTVVPRRDPEPFKFIIESTAGAGVPVVGFAPKYTEGGAVFSFGPDFADVGAQAAEVVGRVLGGATPAQIGIQNARKVSLSVNLKAAAALGIEVSKDVVAGADEVFK